MYVVLVGEPGTGKGEALGPAESMLREANTANILSDRLTIEFVLEKMANGFSSATHTTGGTIKLGKDSSAFIYSPELSVFIRSHSEMLGDLASLWDSREGTFQYGTRGKGETNITDPCVCLFGGTPPRWISKSIPPDAVGGGLTRRMNFVFGVENKKGKSPWSQNHVGSTDKIVNDLRHIGALSGEFKFSSAAEIVFANVYSESVPEEFDDEATALYKSSQWVHVLKLAMVLSTARRDTLELTESDMLDAYAQVKRLMKDLGTVFRSVGESDLTSAADKVVRYIESHGMASYNEILHANWQHVSAETLTKVLQTLTMGGVLQEISKGNKVFYTIIPLNPGGTP
jgi:hypothetical protein